MSVKKEPSGRRSIQVEVEVPGTPEEVWRAISTGSGISSWFVPTELDERLGGTIKMHFGPGMDSTATITAWEPNIRFAAESRYLGEHAPAIATEWFVEARPGGMCIVRVVQSLFAETADWDGELEGTESGWPLYFRVLRLYLTQFRGMSGKSMIAMSFSSGTEFQAWKKLSELLALSSTIPGQRFKTGSGAPQISGTVEWDRTQQTQPTLVLRLTDPAPGIAVVSTANCGGGVLICVSEYFYGNAATEVAQKQESEWQAWINERFPAPAPS